MGLTTSLELKKEDKFRSKKDLSIMIYYFPTFFSDVRRVCCMGLEKEEKK